MATCLYCQQDNPDDLATCQHCGMALPQQQKQRAAQRLVRFKWFVIALTIFCAIMIIWLPRSMPS
ncbi:DnrP protein [Thiopseudomonas acetoxidans]|uniref:DnrP protein n=1 Tax=Thiopseudomonas acetoxidans TaxID=3041622 RepID=A0ABT7SR48_9GAMM|nr:DnrP protein [Thiopseudomonas sp. CY1220]MDM7858671.1 DnrP protein [Thiopseudomonas sp. CY1220]NLC08949.1 DnrP protein [Gammaproteobacteria bacterium]